MLESAAQKGAETALNAHLDNHKETIQADISVDASRGVSTDMSRKYNERVEVGRAHDGAPVYKWASGNTKRELHLHIAQLITGFQPETVAAEDEADDTADKQVLFEAYAMDWLETFKLVGLEEKTKYVYRSRMRNLMPEFGNMHIADINSTHIQKWLNRLADEGKAKSTLRDMLNMLKQCLSAAVDDA